MKRVKFKTPYFSSFFESAGTVVAEHGNYITVAVDSGYLAGKTTDVSRSMAISEETPVTHERLPEVS
jgi:hypothetical protein